MSTGTPGHDRDIAGTCPDAVTGEVLSVRAHAPDAGATTLVEVVRGWLGVQIQPVTPDIADSLGLDAARGALVSQPQDNSPAAAAGITACMTMASAAAARAVGIPGDFGAIRFPAADQADTRAGNGPVRDGRRPRSAVAQTRRDGRAAGNDPLRLHPRGVFRSRPRKKSTR